MQCNREKLLHQYVAVMTLQARYHTLFKSYTTRNARGISVRHPHISNHFKEMSFIIIGHRVACCGHICSIIIGCERIKFRSQTHFHQVCGGYRAVFRLPFDVKNCGKYVVHHIFLYVHNIKVVPQ
jgi:hypothetical protein